MSNSATAPAVALVLGIVLLAVGGAILKILGAFLVLGGGILFVVRVVGLLFSKSKPPT
jgi:hypothetical protein